MTTRKTPVSKRQKPPVEGLYPANASKSAVAKAKQVSTRIAAMTPAKRKKMIATLLEIEANRRPPHQGTSRAVKSDLFAILNAIGGEFIRRYYPDATNASIHVTKYPDGPGMPLYSLMLPLAVPASKEGGAGV